MITKWWKKAVGTIGINTGSCYATGVSMISTHTVNLIDVSGALIPNIIMAAAASNTSYFLQSSCAAKNNASLLGNISTDINPETVEIGGSYQKYAGACKMVFGAGNTAPTNTDYNLENPITDGITIESYSTQHAYNESTGNYEQVITMCGSVTEDVTISEAGIIKSIWTSGTDYNKTENYSNILVCREVLEEPLVLKAGDGFTISVMIEQ